MTQRNFSLYSVSMEAELKSLEEKIAQFAELCQRLRQDSHELRQRLATALNENRVLEGPIIIV